MSEENMDNEINELGDLFSGEIAAPEEMKIPEKKKEKKANTTKVSYNYKREAKKIKDLVGVHSFIPALIENKKYKFASSLVIIQDVQPSNDDMFTVFYYPYLGSKKFQRSSVTVSLDADIFVLIGKQKTKMLDSLCANVKNNLSSMASEMDAFDFGVVSRLCYKQGEDILFVTKNVLNPKVCAGKTNGELVNEIHKNLQLTKFATLNDIGIPAADQDMKQFVEKNIYNTHPIGKVPFRHAMTAIGVKNYDTLRVLDHIVGVAYIAMMGKYESEIKRTYFGRAGSYMEKDGVYWYTGLGPMIFSHPLITTIMMRLIDAVLRVDKLGVTNMVWESTDQEVINAINTNSREEAIGILNKNKANFLLLLRCAFPNIRQDFLEQTRDVFINGIDDAIINPKDGFCENWCVDGKWIAYS